MIKQKSIEQDHTRQKSLCHLLTIKVSMSSSCSSPKPKAMCIVRNSTESMENRTFLTEICELLVWFGSTKT